MTEVDAKCQRSINSDKKLSRKLQEATLRAANSDTKVAKLEINKKIQRATRTCGSESVQKYESVPKSGIE